VADTPTDDPLLKEIDEELRQEKYIELWRKYGTFIIAGVVALIASVGGYQAWHSYMEESRQTAGEQFERATKLVQSGKRDNAVTAFAKLAEEGPSGYALLAKFEQAAILGREGNKTSAAAIYRTIANDDSYNVTYRDLATLLGTLQEMESSDPVVLIQRLAPLTGADNPWRYTARELTGILAYRKGDVDQARSLFTALSNDNLAPAGVRERSAAMMGILGTSAREG
jgi:hypothetical protein